jgi:hypothetical protein
MFQMTILDKLKLVAKQDCITPPACHPESQHSEAPTRMKTNYASNDMPSRIPSLRFAEAER